MNPVSSVRRWVSAVGAACLLLPAMAGAQLMEDAGFKNVYRLEGNYGAWVDAGNDVEK